MQRERRPHVLVRRALPALILLSGAGALVIGTDTAHAGLATSSAPVFPNTVRLGATGVPASVVLANANSGQDMSSPTSVCNAGDAAPCPSTEQGITLIPSCGAIGDFSTCATADPGVFRLSTRGVGAPRSSCPGMGFTITEIDAVLGRYRFTPDGGAQVPLPGDGGTCQVDLKVDVLKLPTVDQDAGREGLQTVQVSDHTVYANTLLASARGTSTGVTVLRALPAISTTATSSVPIGGQVADIATVTGLASPIPGGTVTFNLYGVDDPTCAGAPIHTSTVPLQVDASNTGGTATAAPYTSDRLGELHWIATYNGDQNNEPVSGVCSDPTETTNVVRHQPAITTVASAPTQVGGELTDVATVTGLYLPSSAATVTFRLYGPDDAACVTQAAAANTVPLVIDPSGTSGTATAPAFTTTAAGTYRWIATFDGDANNAPVSGTCGDPTETVMVTRTTIPVGNLPETR